MSGAESDVVAHRVSPRFSPQTSLSSITMPFVSTPHRGSSHVGAAATVTMTLDEPAFTKPRARDRLGRRLSYRASPLLRSSRADAALRRREMTRRHTGEVGTTFSDIDQRLTTWLQSQPVFFVATAPLECEGLVNCSPKGNRDEFVVIDPTTVAYLDQTGSGVETLAHLRQNGRIVLMFCAFVGAPRVVRLHGTGRAVEKGAADFAALAARFPRGGDVGVRAVMVVDVVRIADSCGYGVPFMEFTEHRPTMDQWATRKGPAGILDYWSTKNRESIDGLAGLDLEE